MKRLTLEPGDRIVFKNMVSIIDPATNANHNLKHIKDGDKAICLGYDDEHNINFRMVKEETGEVFLLPMYVIGRLTNVWDFS